MKNCETEIERMWEKKAERERDKYLQMRNRESEFKEKDGKRNREKWGRKKDEISEVEIENDWERKRQW